MTLEDLFLEEETHTSKRLNNQLLYYPPPMRMMTPMAKEKKQLHS